MIKLGVKMNLGKEVSRGDIEAIKPDAVIIATGGVPTMPEIPGIDSRKVVSSADLHRKLKFFLRFMAPETLRWLTKFYLPIGKRVVIIGGSLHGCELGEFLTKRGRRVTIVEKSERTGAGNGGRYPGLPLHVVPEKERYPDKRRQGVRGNYEKGLTIINKDGEKQTIKADTIIPALPLAPNLEFYESLKGKVPEIYAVGDCKEPLLIADAVSAGMQIARNI